MYKQKYEVKAENWDSNINILLQYIGSDKSPPCVLLFPKLIKIFVQIFASFVHFYVSKKNEIWEVRIGRQQIFKKRKRQFN